MSLHRLPIVQIPFQDEPTVVLNVHVFWGMVAFPGHKDVVASANLPHFDMLPSAVTLVKSLPTAQDARITFESAAAEGGLLQREVRCHSLCCAGKR